MINTKLDHLLLRPAILISLLTTQRSRNIASVQIFTNFTVMTMSNFQNISYKTSQPDPPKLCVTVEKTRYLNRTAQINKLYKN